MGGGGAGWGSGRGGGGGEGSGGGGRGGRDRGGEQGGRAWLDQSKSSLQAACFLLLYLDLPEVHRLPDELIVLGQLLSGGQLDKHLAQLAAITAVRGGGGRPLGHFKSRKLAL